MGLLMQLLLGMFIAVAVWDDRVAFVPLLLLRNATLIKVAQKTLIMRSFSGCLAQFLGWCWRISKVEAGLSA
jgi:hypothetical protein